MFIKLLVWLLPGVSDLFLRPCHTTYRVAQKKLATIKNHHYIVLKIASASTFLINFEYKMSTIKLLVCIKYSLRDLLFDVSNYA